MNYKTREEWLEAATAELWPLFDGYAPEAGRSVKVSVGWPSVRGTSTKNKVIGQCWKRDVSQDEKSNHVFISPTLGDPVNVLETLVHEMVHAVDDCEHGHKGPFARIAKAIGLEGKMTATHAGEELRGKLESIVEKLGPYPHSALNPLARIPKQSTRMIKLVASDCCGYTVRTTRKWLEAGQPQCPHGNDMEEE